MQPDKKRPRRGRTGADKTENLWRGDFGAALFCHAPRKLSRDFSGPVLVNRRIRRGGAK